MSGNGLSGESNSTSSRRVTIENPSSELVAALAAQIELPPDTANDRWRVSGVRFVDADVQITRTTSHGSDATTEQPIMWDDAVEST